MTKSLLSILVFLTLFTACDLFRSTTNRSSVYSRINNNGSVIYEENIISSSKNGINTIEIVTKMSSKKLPLKKLKEIYNEQNN